MERIARTLRQLQSGILKDKFILGIVISSLVALSMVALIVSDDRKTAEDAVSIPQGKSQEALTNASPSQSSVKRNGTSQLPTPTPILTPSVTPNSNLIKVSGIYFDEHFEKITFPNMRMTITDIAANKSSFAYGQEWNESSILPLTPGSYFFRPYPQTGYDSYVASCSGCDYKQLAYTSYDGLEISLKSGEERHIYVQYRKTSSNAPTSTPVLQKPPEVSVDYPRDGDSIKFPYASQVCVTVTQSYSGPNFKARWNINNAGWTDYSSSTTTPCYDAPEGANTLQIQFKNDFGETGVTTRNFTYLHPGS